MIKVGTLSRTWRYHSWLSERNPDHDPPKRNIVLASRCARLSTHCGLVAGFLIILRNDVSQSHPARQPSCTQRTTMPGPHKNKT